MDDVTTEDRKWRRLDGNHDYCATKCPCCSSTSEIYARYIDEMHWCMNCDTNWTADDPDPAPLTSEEKP